MHLSLHSAVQYRLPERLRLHIAQSVTLKASTHVQGTVGLDHTPCSCSRLRFLIDCTLPSRTTHAHKADVFEVSIFFPHTLYIPASPFFSPLPYQGRAL